MIQQISAQDVVVLMTHSYEQDEECLSSLLPLRPRYSGPLGSRRRRSLLIVEAAAILGWSIMEWCEKISAPIGLDIGGEGPEAIALAIMAEAQACCTGKQIDARRLSVEQVHSCLADDSWQDTVVVSHAEWGDGMGTSLARGIEAVDSVTGAVVMTCDMPAVTATHLVALQATGEVTTSVRRTTRSSSLLSICRLS